MAQGYWEDIGTVEAFYNANLALANPATAQFSFYDRDAPIYTMSRFLPPSKVRTGLTDRHDRLAGNVAAAGNPRSHWDWWKGTAVHGWAGLTHPEWWARGRCQ